MMVRVFFMLALSLIFNACNGQQQAKTTQESTPERTFEMVSVPSMITDPQERAEYLSKHYWDKFDFKDTTLTHLPEVTEQALTNFIDIMKYVSPETASVSIKGMMGKAEADSTMFAYFSNLYEKYLYDPNSPMRNEELYISVLEKILESPVLDEVNKIRPAHLLELAKKNRVGEKAINFTYTMANGQSGTLYNVKADYLLLFFYNPGCEACKEIIEQLTTSSLLADLLKNKKIKILAVYPDEDLAAWKDYVSHIPSTWINSFDKSVSLKNDEIYDLKAIPTLYLLDADKKVILKDATFNQVEEFLQYKLYK